MAQLVLNAIAGITVAALCLKVWMLQRNLKTARKAGFPTFVSPVHIQDLWWLILHKLLVPYLDLLPRSWTQPWLSLGQLWRIWHVGHKPFEEAGSDTIVLATPNGNVLWTCDPSVVRQLFTSPNAEIPVDVMKFVNIWGPTVSTVQGSEWRNHRRAITYGLSSSINSTVWKETIHQTNGLINVWIPKEPEVAVMEHWTARLVLHISSSVLFNQRIEWRSKSENKEPEDLQHITFENALFTVIDQLGLIFVVPRFFLRLPIGALKKTHQSLTALTAYMKNMLSSASANIDEIRRKPTNSLLESIVLAGTEDPDQLNDQTRTLSEESVIGNLFVTLVSGHHTSGNTLAFALLLLAVYPEHQREVQIQLDDHFGDRPQNQWTVEQDYPALQQGLLGAVLKEVLRLYCVIEFVFRTTLAPISVTTSVGTQHTIPENTTCVINFSAAMQNPSFWARRIVDPKRRAELHNSHSLDFDPNRWLGDEKNTENYWPFGFGFRKCPGKSFAEVVLVAALATMLKDYSIKLVIDEETLLESNGDKKVAWEKTRDMAMRKLEDSITVNLNVSITDKLPVEIIQRKR